MPFDVSDIKDMIDRSRHGGVLPGTVLEVDWTELPSDAAQSPVAKALSGIKGHLTLRDTIALLDRATADDRVSGLVARVQPAGAPIGLVQELRDAVLRFRAAGKSTVAYAESLSSNAAFHLAAAFERVVVMEVGSVWITGLRAQVTFLGDALPNAGLEPQFLQRHEYKSMADVFTRTDFSDAHREATARLLEATQQQRIDDVVADRGLDPAAVESAFAEGPFSPTEAIERGLIDEVGHRDEVWEKAKGDGHLLHLARYGHHTKPKKRERHGRPKVAVVAVTGAIASGTSGMKPGIPPGPGTGSDTVVKGLREAAADEDVAAIVLRVDSPGGSAIASDAIHRAVVLAREAGTPVVSSMGTVAASGGYYVSCACDRIVANRGTITGSIGVVMGKLVTSGLRERVKLATRTIDTSDNAGLMSSIEPWEGDQLETMDAEIDRTYELFVRRVADGRGLAADDVHDVAKGRVWVGADAAERGLVDVLGGFHEAVAEAKRLAGIDPDAEVDLVELPASSPLDVLKKEENSEPVAARVVGAGLAVLHRAVSDWERAAQPKGAQMRLPGDLRVD